MKAPLCQIGLCLVSISLVEATRVHLGLDIDITHGLDPPSGPSKSRLSAPLASYRAPAVLEDYQIDVDHGKHRGFLSEDGEYIKFSNIPYAAPPNTNETRFLSPIYPEYKEEGVINGTGTRKCPQALPGWVPSSLEFLDQFSHNVTTPLNSKWATPIGPDNYGKIPEQEGSEDCLYLDVSVPKKVWDNRNRPAIFKPAVVIWIHGGGFVLGSKDDIKSAEGLFTAANKTEPEDNIVFVSINYRLGMFGWMGGDKFADEWGEANLGLLDQKSAINWVARNIYKVGGDSRRLTVMGQSAGGASIVHQLTYHGGYPTYRPDFQKAIIQSPGFFPSPNFTESDLTYAKVLKMANVTNLEELMNVKPEDLIRINQKIVWNSTYGQFTFGPTTRNYATPRLPGQLFKDGSFHEGVHVLLGYTGLDGLLFTPPWVRTNEALRKHVRTIYPGVTEEVLDEINSKYPLLDPKDNALQQRLTGLALSNMFSDIAIKSNIYYVTEALKSDGRKPIQAFRYVFNANPPVHGNDLNYAFYPEKPLSGVDEANSTLAERLQQNLVDFIRYVDPNPEGKEDWKPYDKDNRKVVNYGHMRSFIPWKLPDSEWQFEDDPMTASTRDNCEFWRTAPYYQPKERSRAYLVDQSRPFNLEL